MKKRSKQEMRWVLPCLLLLAGVVCAEDFVAFNVDATAGATPNTLFRQTNGVVVWSTTANVTGITQLDVGPDGNVYASTSNTKICKMWNGTTGAQMPNKFTIAGRLYDICFGNDVDGDGIEDLYAFEDNGDPAGGKIYSYTSSSGYTALGSYQVSNTVLVRGCWGGDFGADVTGDGIQDLYVMDDLTQNATCHLLVVDGKTGAKVNEWAVLSSFANRPGTVVGGSDGRIYLTGRSNNTVVSWLPDGTDPKTHMSGGVYTNFPQQICEGIPGQWYIANRNAVSGFSADLGGNVVVSPDNFATFNLVHNGFAATTNFNSIATFEKGAGRGSAHTPVPTGTLVNSEVVSSVSWYSPNQDGNGAAKPDPNIVSVGYDVYWSTADANFIGEAAVSVNQTEQSFTPTPAITYNTTYYWRVDTRVTWDSNSITGNLTDVIEGANWKFTTKPAYLPPIMTFGNVITAMDLPPATLSATVTNNSLPITSAVFTLLTDDAEFPVGAVATLTPTTVNNQNPTATLTTDMAGNYKVKLAVTDGVTPIEAVVVVKVHADDCQAKKDAGGWVANYYDRNSDCHVDLTDFATLALQWLNDTTLAAQVPYTGIVGYVPLAVYNIRTEAEWVDPNDPNACSDGPISDTTGIRLQNNATASGGKNTGSATAGAWIEYTIDVPASAVGVPTDLYMGYGLNTGTQTLSFGTAENAAAYGIGTVSSTGSWYVFPGVKVGTVTFTTAGPQKVRTTYGGGLNVDWFSFAF